MLNQKRVVLEACVENRSKALNVFKKQLQKIGVLPDNMFLCCEETGSYASNLIEWSAQYGDKLWVKNALQIKK